MIDFCDLQPLTIGLPKMVMLTDIPWGPVTRICEGFIASGLDVTILCLNKKAHLYAESCSQVQSNIVEVQDNGKSLFYKFLALTKINLSKFPHRPVAFENSFFDVSINVNLQNQPDFANAKLIFICNAHGLIDWNTVQASFADKAVVWRLAAAAGYTGFCNCTAGCEKWQEGGCKQCPQLGDSTNNKDIIQDIFNTKRKNYAGLNMATVTPSSWMGQCVQNSLLLKHCPQVTIPTSVKLDVYAPQPQHEARAFFNLPQDARIILYGSGSFRKNKGFHLLCEALTLLHGQWNGDAPLLCFFGKNAPEEILPDGYTSINLGYLDDVTVLAKAYAAADVFVSPSFQDNLPNTVNEALACGTPVVCFDKFSSEDVVINGITGYTAKHPGLPLAADGSRVQVPEYSVSPDSLTDLAAKVKQVLEMPRKDYETMRKTCREKSLEFFSPVLQTARYLCLYRQLLGLPAVHIPGIPE